MHDWLRKGAWMAQEPESVTAACGNHVGGNSDCFSFQGSRKRSH